MARKYQNDGKSRHFQRKSHLKFGQKRYKIADSWTTKVYLIFQDGSITSIDDEIDESKVLKVLNTTLFESFTLYTPSKGTDFHVWDKPLSLNEMKEWTTCK